MKILPGNGGQTTLADNETKRGVKKKKKELDFAATNGAPYPIEKKKTAYARCSAIAPLRMSLEGSG